MTARTQIDGKQERLVVQVCNYSGEPYELKADYYLAHAEPVECIRGPREKLSDELCTSSDINMLSVSTGAITSMDLLPTVERDPVMILHATTIGVSTMAADANILLPMRLLRREQLRPRMT